MPSDVAISEQAIAKERRRALEQDIKNKLFPDNVRFDKDKYDLWQMVLSLSNYAYAEGLWTD